MPVIAQSAYNPVVCKWYQLSDKWACVTFNAWFSTIVESCCVSNTKSNGHFSNRKFKKKSILW